MMARRRWPFSPAMGTGVVGLIVTGVLVSVSVSLYHSNERHLLDLRARDASSVLNAAVPSIQTPLASAAALADATRGSRAKFSRFVRPYVGAGAGHPLISASLWLVGAPERGPVAVVGAPPVLAQSISKAAAFITHAARMPNLNVISLLLGPTPRIGYAYVGPSANDPGPFAAYGESPIPVGRYSVPQRGAAFSDVNYAIYLGRAERPSALLVTSVRHLPLPGRHSAVSVPFGDSFLTLVVSARQPLGGSLPQRLPWAIAIAGVLLTLGAAALAVVLIQRRRQAEDLADRLEAIAGENRRLYTEQRDIAQTLQHALLPDALPQLPGLQASARYEPGVEGVEVGGDWYDLIVLDDRRLLLVVGDVSGRGLRAATTMAYLRYAIHAYAAQSDPPDAILAKLSRLIDVKSSGQLATVLCVLIDVTGQQLTLASAGHLPPLLISDGHTDFLRSELGSPIGVEHDASYSSATVVVPPGATLLAFTDGLVERRGESLDVGLSRLRRTALGNDASLDALLTRILSELHDESSQDDTAIAGIRWTS